MYTAILFLAFSANPQAPCPPQNMAGRVEDATTAEPCCSSACTCGCNDGLPCRCGTASTTHSHAAPAPQAAPVPVWQPVPVYQPAPVYAAPAAFWGFRQPARTMRFQGGTCSASG